MNVGGIGIKGILTEVRVETRELWVGGRRLVGWSRTGIGLSGGEGFGV